MIDGLRGREEVLLICGERFIMTLKSTSRRFTVKSHPPSHSRELPELQFLLWCC